MLKSSNPETDPNEILQAFIDDTDHELSGHFPMSRELQIDFEHGQWFVTHIPSGAQWSAHDCEPGDFCFEQVSEGELDEWLTENRDHDSDE